MKFNLSGAKQRYGGHTLALAATRSLSRGTTLIGRLSRQRDAGEAAPWYTRPWVTIAAMYVFIPFGPLGIYLMWRYRPWPRWLKALSTIAGPIGAVIGILVTRRIFSILPPP